MAARREYAEKLAEDLLKELNSATYFDMPVDVERAAKRLGLSVTHVDFAKLQGVSPDASGFLLVSEKAIVLNSSHHETRRRFTLAHELGHYLMHRDEMEGDVVYRDTISSLGTNPREIEANAFAAAFLMPADLFDAISTMYKDPHKVARFFGVSQQAIGIREQTIAERFRAKFMAE